MSSLYNIESVRYNEGANILSITYKGGSVWDYHPVNPETYAALTASESLIRSIHTALRQGTVCITVSGTVFLLGMISLSINPLSDLRLQRITNG